MPPTPHFSVRAGRGCFVAKCTVGLYFELLAMLLKMPEWPVPTGAQRTTLNFEWRREEFRHASDNALPPSFPHRHASGLRGASDDSFSMFAMLSRCPSGQSLPARTGIVTPRGSTAAPIRGSVSEASRAFRGAGASAKRKRRAQAQRQTQMTAGSKAARPQGLGPGGTCGAP